MKKRKKVFKLTNDERKLESEIARGEWKTMPKNEFNRIHREMVEASGNKDARVNLRLNSEDVSKIRNKAAHEGIPYQTQIASVLHKYATDQLLDEKAVRTVVHQMESKKV